MDFSTVGKSLRQYFGLFCLQRRFNIGDNKAWRFANDAINFETVATAYGRVYDLCVYIHFNVWMQGQE